MSPSPAPGRAAVGFAFAAVWIIWGSTYLAIAWVLETLPPFLMAGLRFLFAGGLLLGWAALRGHQLPTASQWRRATLVGALLLLGGNGGVCWAEQYLASGLVALIVASVPAWMVLFDWLRPGGTRPRPLTMVGLALGFVGVALLVMPSASGTGAAGVAMDGVAMDGVAAGGLAAGGLAAGGLAAGTAATGIASPTGLAAFAGLVVLCGSACWAMGSIVSQRGGLPKSGLVSTASQMIAGGACLALAGLVAGEPARIDLFEVSLKSWLALAYLVVFGSLVAFSCYAWLLRVSTPAKVSTYAYVNPVVAVALGTLAGEALHPGTLLAGVLIIAGVVAITSQRAR